MSGKSTLSVKAVKEAMKKTAPGVAVNPLVKAEPLTDLRAAPAKLSAKASEPIIPVAAIPLALADVVAVPEKAPRKRASKKATAEAASGAGEPVTSASSAAVEEAVHEEELVDGVEGIVEAEKKVKVKQQFVLVTDSVSHLRERGLVPKKALSPGQYNSASPADAARKAGRSLASLFFNNSECAFDFSILNTGTGKKYDYTFSRSPLDGDAKEVIRKGIDKATGEAKEVKYTVKFKNVVSSRNPRGRKRAEPAVVV